MSVRGTPGVGGKRRRGGRWFRVPVARRWSRVFVGRAARARTSARPTLAALSRLFPRTGSTPMVMVPRGRCWWWLTTMFQRHPPLPRPASSRSPFGSLSRICAVKLLTLLPANLAPPFFLPAPPLSLSFPRAASPILSPAASIPRANCAIFRARRRGGKRKPRKPREKCRRPRLNAIFTATR